MAITAKTVTTTTTAITTTRKQSTTQNNCNTRFVFAALTQRSSEES
jgi:hypothetical protein